MTKEESQADRIERILCKLPNISDIIEVKE